MTPEQEEQVARALAETARHEPVPPVPADVAARLDGVLADLVRARGADADGTPEGATPGAIVDEVAARRRRRRPNVLVAAAAVALIVAAGGVVATGGFGIGSRSGSETTSAGGRSTLDSSPDAAGDRAAPENAAPAPSAARAAVPRLRTSSLAQDVQRVLADDPTDAEAGPGPRRKALSGPPLASDGCVAPPVGPGEQVLAVRLDGRPATLVLGPVRADSRSADVYSCRDATTPVAATTVPLG